MPNLMSQKSLEKSPTINKRRGFSKNSIVNELKFNYYLFSGKGGFGYVVLCKNKLDGRHYAMKKIRLSDKSPSLNNKILRYFLF